MLQVYVNKPLLRYGTLPLFQRVPFCFVLDSPCPFLPESATHFFFIIMELISYKLGNRFESRRQLPASLVIGVLEHDWKCNCVEDIMFHTAILRESSVGDWRVFCLDKHLACEELASRKQALVTVSGSLVPGQYRRGWGPPQPFRWFLLPRSPALKADSLSSELWQGEKPKRYHVYLNNILWRHTNG